jgi:hypothetical protein
LKLRLIRSKPAAGERKFLPNRALPICPACFGTLAINVHPAEKLQAFALLPGLAVLFKILSTERLRSEQDTWILFGIAAGLILIGTGVVIWVNFRFLRLWNRYK